MINNTSFFEINLLLDLPALPPISYNLLLDLIDHLPLRIHVPLFEHARYLIRLHLLHLPVLQLVFEDYVEYGGVDVIELAERLRCEFHVVLQELLPVLPTPQIPQLVCDRLVGVLAVLLDRGEGLPEGVPVVLEVQLLLFHLLEEGGGQEHFMHVVLQNTPKQGVL